MNNNIKSITDILGNKAPTIYGLSSLKKDEGTETSLLFSLRNQSVSLQLLNDDIFNINFNNNNVLQINNNKINFPYSINTTNIICNDILNINSDLLNISGILNIKGNTNIFENVNPVIKALNLNLDNNSIPIDIGSNSGIIIRNINGSNSYILTDELAKQFMIKAPLSNKQIIATLDLLNNSNIKYNLTVSGNSTFNNMIISNNTKLFDTIIYNNLNVLNTVNINKNVIMYNNLNISNRSSLQNLNISNHLNVNNLFNTNNLYVSNLSTLFNVNING